jgi:uncharacterized protein (TIRG00374 family)
VRVRWSAAIGIAITLLLLWWVLHDVRPAAVWQQIRAARWGWLLAAVAVATLTFPLRTVRWRLLLRYEGAPLPWIPLWHATAIGFMANNLIGRAGELARAFAASRLTSARFTTAVASVAVERMFDGIVLLVLLMLGLGAGGFGREALIGGVSVRHLTTWAAFLFGGLLAAALLVVALPNLTLRLAEAVTGRLLPARWRARAIELLHGLLDGLWALRTPRRIAAVVWWSLVLWVTNGLSFWLAFKAFGLTLSWGPALVLQGVVAFGVAVPSTPGFWGVFEGATRAALTLYAVPPAVAASLAIGYHIAAFIPITVLGLWSLWHADLRLSDLRAGAPPPVPPTPPTPHA